MGDHPTSVMPDGVERGVDAPIELGTTKAEVRRAERDILANGGHEELVVGVLEHDSHPPSDLAEVAAGDGSPPIVTEPGPPPSTPLRWRTRVVLPAPFGPRMATRSPGRHGERHIVERRRAVGVA